MTMTEIVLQMSDEFVDYKSLKLSDVDLLMVTLKAQGMRTHGKINTNPERSLVRF
jgi:hypothetical protein